VFVLGLRSLSERLNAWSDKINLRKRFPDYFRAWVFRSAFLIVFVLLLVAVKIDGTSILWGQEPWHECPATGSPCENPFWYCMQGPFVSTKIMGQSYDCEGVEVVCAEHPEFCYGEWLAPGEVRGNKPSEFSQSFTLIMWLILGFAFVVNHILYRWRSKN